MYMLIGLGNPGQKYYNTRHNMGFLLLDSFAKKTKWQKSKSGLLEYQWQKFADKELELIKPLTFMNKSGEAVKYALKKHDKLKLAHELIVIHDDLDIPLGQSKLQLATGPKQHNGISSIESVLKTNQFWRLRMGVDNRQGDHKIPGQKYVLQPFTKDEKEVVDHGITKGIEKIITHLNNA